MFVCFCGACGWSGDIVLRAEMVDLMADVKAAGLRLGALTNDMTAFHGPELGGPPGAPEAVRRDRRRQPDRGDEAGSARVPQGAEALGLPAEQIVFLDDMPWNAEAAREAGTGRRPGALG